MLGVFNQNKLTSDRRILNIDEESYPEKYRSIIRRLQRAISEPVVRKKMDVEDEITNEFKKMARTIQQQKEDLIESDKSMEEKDQALENVLEEKDQALKEKDQALKEKDQVLKEKEQALKEMEEKDKLIRELLKKQEST
ncbi:MAG: hypothetical protein GY765_35445 [bacterium]|nr:hypothetical protein [bacterium]